MPERIRVLRIITRLNIGGPALHATLLTEELDRARYDSTLVAGVEDGAEGNYLALHGRSLDGLIVLDELGRAIHARRDVAMLGKLVRLMRQLKPDIVHTHEAKAGALGRIAALVTGVPVLVHTYHGHVFHGYFSPLRTRAFLAIERWLARRTTRLIAVSESVKADLLRFGIGAPDQLIVVPLGLPLDRFVGSAARKGEFRVELGLEPDTPLVGIVARLAPIKAHNLFLEAASMVAQARPRSRFVVVGDGECRSVLEIVARRLGLAEGVQFLGWRRDLERIYADLDLVVLSSRNEGSPVSVIEAMAAARPVVATRVGGVPDLVENGVSGLLVEPGDAAGLAQAMLTVLADPDQAHRMGRAGQKRVYPAFSAARLVGDLDGLYGRLLLETGTARRPR
jgi:glycosyltransferase involved in cell wall biosynthesis